MTQREEFEAWFHKYDDNNFMTAEDRELVFDAWQAAKAQAVPQWIPIGERLPAYGDDCLIVAEGKCEPENIVYEFTKDKFSSDDQFVSIPGGEDYFYARNVSFWMPLPSAPEQNK